jgi:hypothetical protein
MCLFLLLFLLARRAPIAALYLLQALATLAVSLAVLFGERPVLVCVMHLVLTCGYIGFAFVHAGRGHEWLRMGRAGPGADADSHSRDT